MERHCRSIGYFTKYFMYLQKWFAKKQIQIWNDNVVPNVIFIVWLVSGCRAIGFKNVDPNVFGTGKLVQPKRVEIVDPNHLVRPFFSHWVDIVDPNQSHFCSAVWKNLPRLSNYFLLNFHVWNMYLMIKPKGVWTW